MKRVAYFASLMFLATSGIAQEKSTQQKDSESDSPVITSISTLVTVPALVRSASGDLVTSLSARDFRLTDNGVEQHLIAEQAQHQPLAIVILMQTGGAAPREFQNYRTFSKMLASLIGPVTGDADHRVALVTFDSHLREIWNFPPRIDGLKHAFANPEGGDSGAAIMDALNCGIAMLEKQPVSERRVLLLLSQSQDEGSKIASEAVIQRLAESNTTVYSISFAPQHPHPKRSRLAKTSTNSPQTLAEAAKALGENTSAEAAALSGGEYVGLKSKDDLDRTLSVLATDFASSYLLSFHPNTHQPGFHSLDVQLVKNPKHLPVAARTAYWIRSSADADGAGR